MWTSLFAVTAAIAVALSMAAIVVDSANGGSSACNCVLSEAKTWAALGPPIFIAGEVLPGAGTLQ